MKVVGIYFNIYSICTLNLCSIYFLGISNFVEMHVGGLLYRPCLLHFKGLSLLSKKETFTTPLRRLDTVILYQG